MIEHPYTGCHEKRLTFMLITKHELYPEVLREGRSPQHWPHFPVEWPSFFFVRGI